MISWTLLSLRVSGGLAYWDCHFEVHGHHVPVTVVALDMLVPVGFGDTGSLVALGTAFVPSCVPMSLVGTVPPIPAARGRAAPGGDHLRPGHRWWV